MVMSCAAISTVLPGMTHRVRSFALKSLSCLLVALLPSALPAAKIERVEPAAVVTGEATRLVFHGDELEKATELWTSFPADTRRVDPVEGENGAVVFRVFVADDASAAIGAVRLVTPDGVSDLALVLVDNVPALSGSPPRFELPCSISGAVSPVGSDVFDFEFIERGRVAFEVFARRLGSPLDPRIRLLRLRAGSVEEIAAVDDVPGASGDLHLARELDAGSYRVELHDSRHRGGNAFGYVLRMGAFPVVGPSFPPVDPRGVRQLVETTTDLGVWRGIVSVPEDHVGDVYWSAGEFSGDRAVRRIGVSSRLERVEIEPNDDRLSVRGELRVGDAVSGRFVAPRDVDWYRVVVDAGTRLRVRGESARYGFSGSLYLQLFDGEGAQLADAAPASGAIDAREIVHRFAEAGVCYVRAEDLHLGGGAAHGYRLRIDRVEPGFELTFAADRVDVPLRGVLGVKVTAARRDFDGAIGLTPILAHSERVLDVVSGGTIGAGTSETILEVAIPKELGRGTLNVLRVRGEGRFVTSRAVVTFEAENFARSNLAVFENLYISDKGGGLSWAEYEFELEEAGEYELVFRFAAAAARPARLLINGELAASPVLSQTTGGWSADKQQWLPQGTHVFGKKNVMRLERSGAFSHLDKIRIARLTETAGDDAPRPVLATATTAPLLAKQFGVFAGEEFGGDLVIGIGPEFPSFFGLAKKVESVRIARGGDAKLAFVIERRQGFEGAVAITVEGLPPGVRAETMMIEEKKSTTEIELQVASEAETGTHDFRVVAAGVHRHQRERHVLDIELRIEPKSVVETKPVAAAGEKR